jgi:diguanylate cyclase (GGDEF)-like protein/PAS domain S-box-containing protein
MSIKPFSRVRWSICALSLLLLGLSWGYFAVGFKRDHQSIAAHSGQHLQAVALGLEEYVRRLFLAHDMVLIDTIERLLLAESTPLLQSRLNDWLGHLPQLRAVRIVVAESTEVLLEVVADPMLQLGEIIYPATATFKEAISPLQIAGSLYQNQAGENQLILWRQLEIDNRRIQVIALLRTTGLNDFYRSLKLDSQSAIAILHESGVVLVHEPQRGDFAGRLYCDAVTFAGDVAADNAGLLQLPATVDGDNRLVAYRKLAGLPLLVTVGVSNDSIFTNWKIRLQDFLLIQLGVSATILLAICLLVRALSNIEQAELKLFERERHFRAVADSSVDAVISVDREQCVQFWSRGAERIFGVKSSAAQGERLSKYLHFTGALDLQQTLDGLAQLGVSQQSGGTFDVQGIRSNHWIFPTELSVSVGTTGGKPFYTLIVRDVTERKEMEEQIRRLASHDNLTRLPNRSLLMDRLQVAMALIRRQGGQFALLFLDLDEFKPVNDSYGHDVGDQLLQQVAERLQATVRESDTVARVGGDEFAVLLTNVVDKNNLAGACENILKALRREFVLQEFHAGIGVSIGAVLYTGQEMTGSDLMRLADMAMYTAKKAGKNRYVFAAIDVDEEGGSDGAAG